MIGVWNSVKPVLPHPVAQRAHHIGRAASCCGAIPRAAGRGSGSAGGFPRDSPARRRPAAAVRRPAPSTSMSRMKTSISPVGSLRVDQLGVARLHLAVDADAPFGAHLLDLGEGRAVGVGQHLGHAVMVAQVDEKDAAVVAHPVDPARQADGLADMLGPERRRRYGCDRRASVSPPGIVADSRRYTWADGGSQALRPRRGRHARPRGPDPEPTLPAARLRHARVRHSDAGLRTTRRPLAALPYKASGGDKLQGGVGDCWEAVLASDAAFMLGTVMWEGLLTARSVIRDGTLTCTCRQGRLPLWHGGTPVTARLQDPTCRAS